MEELRAIPPRPPDTIMAMKPSNSPLDDRQRFSRLQLVIMFLSIYVVVELFLKAVIDVSPETDAWLVFSAARAANDSPGAQSMMT